MIMKENLKNMTTLSFFDKWEGLFLLKIYEHVKNNANLTMREIIKIKD